MIGGTIILSIVVIMILYLLGSLLYEFINSIRKYGIGRIDIFFIVILIVFVMGIILSSFGI
ncbi:hypothetical protein BU103_11055 [Staphylococcus xylosus]|nr:hypothetical protein BU103_11055 [Staphylococcus xylosus]